MTTALLYLSISLSVILTSLGFFSEGFINPALGLMVFGVVWIIVQNKWVWIASVGISVMAIAAIVGVYFNLSTLFTAGGALFAFIAWDLAEFNSRLRRASKEDDVRGLSKSHFYRLGGILLAAIAFLMLTRFIRVRFTFEIAALLVIVGVWGISLLVGRLRRSE
jgi:hypothetical protein